MSNYSISVPASQTPPSPQSQLIDKTNTLAVTPVPKAFFHPLVLDTLRNHFAMYGEINQWVPLTGFGRILVVYKSDDSAESAKVACDPIIVDSSTDSTQTVLRVYRADPNPLIADFMAEDHYLRPPPIEKNFLISPPGSPPVGWEPIKEEPPNPTPLADDLIAALQKLQPHHKRSDVEVLLEPHDGSGVGVYVQDFDGDEDNEDTQEMDWAYGEPSPARLKWKPVATALPPLHAILV